MTKKQTADQALAAMVDELGDLEGETQPWRAKIARVDTLRAAVRAAFRDRDPTKSFQARGERWECLLGPSGHMSIVDRSMLLKLIGPTQYAHISTVSLKAMQAECGADVLGAVVSTEPTGPRSLSVIPVRSA